ncbi:hypothetical protein [Caproiciproducens faecalis]|uniref:Uncharacterized protein n=1 Tax=Caproiciproducens faecalis TaxID=2820301 RepID=A0ABS7DNJ8_9FIRM|nr:hypothetical protein [Caproiciproducens faecalis]MBW7572880.1 hypothetical protein [Caproiciproducens faecalis]
MNVLTGTIMLLAAGIMAKRFRTRTQSGRGLLGMTAAMGVLTLCFGGGSWPVQTVQFFLQAVVAFCCFLQLRREALVRRRRIHRHPHRAQEPLPGAEKTCA